MRVLQVRPVRLHRGRPARHQRGPNQRLSSPSARVDGEPRGERGGGVPRAALGGARARRGGAHRRRREHHLLARRRRRPHPLAEAAGLLPDVRARLLRHRRHPQPAGGHGCRQRGGVRGGPQGGVGRGAAGRARRHPRHDRRRGQGAGHDRLHDGPRPAQRELPGNRGTVPGCGGERAHRAQLRPDGRGAPPPAGRYPRRHGRQGSAAGVGAAHAAHQRAQLPRR
mmetsp:Transcript_65420/g.175503  ORF Transcript_65420/g.175503 Transcript_65420/m.175503 type:complete len:225 (-) Transcript_65420:74-748(-)